MDYQTIRPAVVGVAIAIFMAATSDLNIADVNWWVAVISLNVLFNL